MNVKVGCVWAGGAWLGCAGLGRQGKDSFELVAVSVNVKAGHGLARTGRARPGSAWLGGAWQGKDSFELVADYENITARPGEARHGQVGLGRRGTARTLSSWWRFP